MLTKEECLYELNELKGKIEAILGEESDTTESIQVLEELIHEHYCLKEKVKLLEKQLDIAIKDLCFTVKGADTCNFLDDLYEAISEKILKQARKEVQE